MKILQLQLMVYDDKEKNMRQLRHWLEAMQEQKPDFVALGEMFNCPYQASNFPKYAEPEGGETWQALSALAKEFGVYISAGSVPERADGKIYNTAYVFDREGNQIAKHRKVHLFDIDVAGGMSFRESDTLSPGDQVTVFDTEFGKMGLCICFDIRFPELARLMVQAGAKVIFVPAAFNMTTGPAHWQLHFRARALDNQCYYVGTCSARDLSASYTAWGHSLITGPWGDVILELDEVPGCPITEIDLPQVEKVRRELPLLSARRTDLYTLTGKPV